MIYLVPYNLPEQLPDFVQTAHARLWLLVEST